MIVKFPVIRNHHSLGDKTLSRGCFCDSVNPTSYSISQWRVRVYYFYTHKSFNMSPSNSTTGLVVKSNVAIVGPRVRFTGGAWYLFRTYILDTRFYSSTQVGSSPPLPWRAFILMMLLFESLHLTHFLIRNDWMWVRKNKDKVLLRWKMDKW